MPEESEPETERELQRVRDPNFSVLYSNWVLGSRSPWDIILTFGHVREADPKKPAIVELATVVMAPALAKAVITTLASAVKGYEEEHGEIPLPAHARKEVQEPSPDTEEMDSLAHPKTTQKQFEERPADKPIPKANLGKDKN